MTTFSDYDPFGRVGTVTPPGQPPVRFTCQGGRVKTCKADISQSAGDLPVFVTELSDAQGR